jgi:hypothetical protein
VGCLLCALCHGGFGPQTQWLFRALTQVLLTSIQVATILCGFGALATTAGMLPLGLGIGSGAQLLRPLAIAVIGGVAVSMVLSLVITPVLFCRLRGRGL